MSSELAKYQSNDGEEILLTKETVREYFCKDATDQELAVFAGQAKMFKANPWAREIYLVKFNGKPASTILSYHVFNRIATSQKDYNGIESGVIVYNAKTGRVERNTGSAYFSQIGQQLIGGWARTWRKGIDHPFEVTVNLSDFNKGTANWKSMPAFMIEKVAKGQSWRLAYPSVFSNVYIEEAEIASEPVSAWRPSSPDDVTVSPAEVEADIVVDDGTDAAGASMDAKQALWTACKAYAEAFNADATAISDGIKRRPDYEDSDEYYRAIAEELDAAVNDKGE